MDGRIAVKLQDEKRSLSAGPWYERIQKGLSRNSQPISLINSCKKGNSSGKEVARDREGKDSETIFTGSLAEVYEKALTNVLNIQPNIKMEENHQSQKNHTDSDKKQTEIPNTWQYIPPEYSISGTFNHPHYRRNDTQLQHHRSKISDGKKLNTVKSAFHVPEKRRPITNGLSRHSHWSFEHRFPYPVNYPGDYYPVIQPSAYYNRGSPYHNAFVDRMNFYPGPRGHEYPVFTHMLPWTPLERDYKPWASPRYREWRPNGAQGGEPEKGKKKFNLEETFNKSPSNTVQESAKMTADDTERFRDKVNETTGLEKSENAEKASANMDYNVKTRRMRAYQKNTEFTKETKKGSFDSPKEEFLFRLGLTRVH